MTSGITRTRGWSRIAFIGLVLLMALMMAAGASADEKGRTNDVTQDVGYVAIEGSPLTINVAKDASYQVIHDAVDPSNPGQVYHPDYQEADAGIFLWFNQTAVGPDFNSHTISASNDYSPWVSTNQSVVTGSGTVADPWIVVTEVANDATGATMTVETLYIDGEDFFRISWEICTSAAGPASTFLAADFYLEGSDDGFGFYDEETGSVGGYNEAQDWYEVFTPISPADHYYEGYYGDVWDLIGDDAIPGAGFNDTILEVYEDNGAGLQWDRTINGCATFGSYWSFGEVLIIPSPTSVETSDISGEMGGTSTTLFVAALALIPVVFLSVRYTLRKTRV